MKDQHESAANEAGDEAGRLVPASRSLAATRDPYAALNPVPGQATGSSLDFRFDPRECLRICRKQIWVIVSSILVVVVSVSLWTLMSTPQYSATVRLQIDRNVVKVVEGGNVTPVEGADFDFLRTQYELIQSRSMAERVAATLRLGEDADFLKARESSYLGSLRSLVPSAAQPPRQSSDKAALERAAAAIVGRNRVVRPLPGSRLVDITYTDPMPARAQKIAAAYGEAFIASNLDKRFQANAYAKTFLEDQIKQLKLRLEDSEKVLLDFAQKEQIVAVTEKSTIAESNLASANAALGVLVSDRIKNEQLWKQVDAASAINLPQLLTNTVIDGLRGRRGALVTEYQEKLETFKPSYPAMVQINNKIAEIDRQLATEVKTIRSSLKAAYESSVSQEQEMKKRIEELRGEVLDLQQRSIQYNILKREVDTNRSLYDGLLQRFKEVDVAGGVGANNIFVVDRAEMPGAPSSPRLSRRILLSIGVGLGIGLAAAFVRERFDDRIRSADEIERVSGLATLGIIPKVRKDASVEDALADPRSPLSENYRSLCTSLQFSTDNGLPRTLLITSAGPSEGKSFTALAVARHFATMGSKVLVIDGDLRNPSMHRKLSAANEVGLSNYLTGACTPPEAFQRTAIPNLTFMPSGPLPPNAADLLASARLHSLLAIGLEVFQLIVIDGPPVLDLADAPLLSSTAAGTILVVGAGDAHSGQVRGALRRLQMARGPVIGTVLTKFDARSAGYGNGHGYGYGNDGYTYGQQVGRENRKPRLPETHESA